MLSLVYASVFTNYIKVLLRKKGIVSSSTFIDACYKIIVNNVNDMFSIFEFKLRLINDVIKYKEVIRSISEELNNSLVEDDFYTTSDLNYSFLTEDQAYEYLSRISYTGNEVILNIPILQWNDVHEYLECNTYNELDTFIYNVLSALEINDDSDCLQSLLDIKALLAPEIESSLGDRSINTIESTLSRAQELAYTDTGMGDVFTIEYPFGFTETVDTRGISGVEGQINVVVDAPQRMLDPCDVPDRPKPDVYKKIAKEMLKKINTKFGLFKEVSQNLPNLLKSSSNGEKKAANVIESLNKFLENRDNESLDDFSMDWNSYISYTRRSYY